MNRYFAVIILCAVFLTGCTRENTADKKYTVDSVLERCGLAGCDEFSEDGNTFNYQRIDNSDNVCLIIMNEESDYYGYSFYIYKSERKAVKELERRKENLFKENEYECGSNWANGWEADVMDASIKLFDYQSRNLIIEVRDENLGADRFADDVWREEYNSEEAKKVRYEAAKENHERIMSEW